jgi:transcriptional regulator with XRE-family HTH domain
MAHRLFTALKGGVKMKNPQDFALFLRRAREQKCLTAALLAEKLGLHPHIIDDWEKGVRTPRLASAIRWADALGHHLELR